MTSADQVELRESILEAVNSIIQAENGPVLVEEVRIVAAPMFFDHTYGTTLLLSDGGVVIRIAVGRPAADVVDTILHETTHVLMGEWFNACHGPQFQEIYERLTQTYTGEYHNPTAILTSE